MVVAVRMVENPISFSGKGKLLNPANTGMVCWVWQSQDQDHPTSQSDRLRRGPVKTVTQQIPWLPKSRVVSCVTLQWEPHQGEV